MDSLVVFSHLRWNFVYQRPQHLMERFAKRYRIFFFEEPMCEAGTPRLVITEPTANVSVCTPRTPFESTGFHDQQLPALQSLIEGLMTERDIRDPIAWLYTPMALPLVSGIHPRAIVYDCMDELAAFKNAPRQLLQREHALLKTVDFVFTGGPSLYRAKRARHHSVHCFPSSVDKAHFESARDTSNEVSAQRAIPHPRLGFFGVIDERLDIGLIDRLAVAHPEWQLIMVGPIVKIDPASLPKHPNVHYFGQQPYADLPHFLAGWDVCLLPFALNDATRFISPTKTLEYMAAGKPIVSTPVEDVATPHGHVVGIGEGEGFVALCESALRETAEERSRRELLMRAVVEATSWDKTASEMRVLIESSIEDRPRDAAHISRRASPGGVAHPSRDDKRPRVVVIGAGPTGLSAAYHIGRDCLLLEQHSTVGGWCRSIEDNGFTFDYAGHIMFSNDPYVKNLYQLLLGENVHWQDREAWIYSKGVYTRYPFQGALYGLPPEVITECIVGAVEARVGPLPETKGLASRPPVGNSPSSCKPESITDCCADGISESQVPLVHPSRARPATASNFEEFIYQVWGKGIAKHFALPYNRKLWAVPLSTMETSWLGGRVPLPDLAEMIDGALRPVPKPMGPNARFGYPLRGGFQALMNGFVEHLTGTLKLNAVVARVIPSRHVVMLGDGSIHPYEHLISTMPLPLLVKIAGEEAPPHVRLAASRLRHVSVRCVNLGIARRDVTDKHWIYYPESSVFHRIFMQGNASPHNAQEGFGFTCEITYSPDKPLPCEGDDLIDLCIKDAIEVGILKPDDRILARNMVDMPHAYVVYDHGRAENVAIIREWAGAHDIILAGRYSEWEYYNSDHAFIAGRNAALAIEAARETRAAASSGPERNASLPDLAEASQ